MITVQDDQMFRSLVRRGRRRARRALVLVASSVVIVGACTSTNQGSSGTTAGGAAEDTTGTAVAGPGAAASADGMTPVSSPDDASKPEQSEPTLAPVAFTVSATGGTFVEQPDGTITGTLTGVDVDADWTATGSDSPNAPLVPAGTPPATGSVPTMAAAKMINGDTLAPAIIRVADAAPDRDAVAISVDVLHVNEDGSIEVAGSRRPDLADTTFASAAAEIDSALDATFGAATLTVERDDTAITDGDPVGGDWHGGSVLIGLQPGVEIKTDYAGGNCVIKQSVFGNFTTNGFVTTKDYAFESDANFWNGCSTEPSWVRWNVYIGAPYNVHGQIFFGQDGIGGSGYYSKCDGDWSIVCVSEGNHPTPEYQGNRIRLLAPACPGSVSVNGIACSSTASAAFQGTPSVSGNFPLDNKHHTLIVNATPDVLCAFVDWRPRLRPSETFPYYNITGTSFKAVNEGGYYVGQRGCSILYLGVND